MIIELHEENNKHFSFEVGDILVFYNGEEYDYYQVTYDPVDKEYCYLCLSISHLYEKNKSLEQLIRDANDPLKNNDFKLIEVLKPNDVVLRRVTDE
ncbi:hypothetical protein ACR77J_07220 [Tissierella praeacuta]|uniref:hypothetical protein n=1 Tax=Tissierella praeacuta TaxID=43131 RepID=UPI003DA40DA2